MGNTTLSKEGLFHLCVVYVVWSSTYLAIRIAVNPEGGFPPFAMGVIRMAPAALILLSLAYFQGKTIKPSSGDILTLCITGILLWVSGNGLQITWWTIAGASLVITSVAGIFADKRRPESTQVASANSVGT